MRPLLLVLWLAVGLSNALWLRQGRSNQPKDTRFIGEATNELSTSILQGYIDENKNIAFSPLGYAAILAILAEGAKGETRNQLVSALHLPENQDVTRKTFRYVMERLKNTNEYKYNQPELKNFFYIYKNYTINEDYKQILEEYYLTEVRSVERYNSELTKPNDASKDSEVTEENSSNSEDKEDSDSSSPSEIEEKYISFAVEDTPEKVDITQVELKPAKNIKEKIKLVKTYPKKEKDELDDEEETMVAVEARNHARSLKILHDKNDISSIVSVNSVGKKSSKPSKSNSLMLLFNGMYFRGSWKQPFEVVEHGVFYKSNTVKKQVPMMKTTGTFKTSSLPDLDSEALLLPYDGGRYALLVVVPRSRDGLTRLIADLPSVPVAEIQETMMDEELQVSLPSFYIETTTKPVAALAKFGVSDIFSRDAELSGISEDEGLFVQELVQHVAVRVDNADSSSTQMSAANPGVESFKNAPLYEERSPRRFCIEHPFIFYIIDRLDNLIVVAGKITDPQQPTPFEI